MTLAKRELDWKRQAESLEREKMDATRLVKEEKVKVDKLVEMVNRLQTEIHTLIKNKFSHGSGGGHNMGGHHNLNQRDWQHGGHGGMGHMGGGLPSSHSYGGGNIKRVQSGQAAPSSSSSAMTGDKRNASVNINNNNSNSPTEQHHGPGGNGNINTHTSSNNSRRDYSNGSSHSASRMGRHIGPHEILAYNGSAEAVRERNAFGSLLDFFGM